MTASSTTDLTTPCPEWCEQHWRSEQPHGIFETHRVTLWVKRLPMNPDSWISLYVLSQSYSDLDGEGFQPYAPSMSVVENVPDAMPMTVTAHDARELAAGLLRGAEAVEAAQTAVCATCGQPAHPAELFDASGDHDPANGHCAACWTEVRRANRPRLVSVNDVHD